MPQSPEGDRLVDLIEEACDDPARLGELRNEVEGANIDAEERTALLGRIEFYLREMEAWETSHLPEGERPAISDVPEGPE